MHRGDLHRRDVGARYLAEVDRSTVRTGYAERAQSVTDEA